MDILVTGFGPFPHVRVNPTTILAREIARRLRRGGLDAQALVLETSYSGGLPALRAFLADRKPRAILMLGLAARARFVRVELFARGRSSQLHPDATGGTAGRASASRALPARTTTNAEGALAILKRRRLRSRLSPSAGRYLCDACYAVALAADSREKVPVLFVHVPWLRPAAGRKPAGRVPAFRPDAASLGAALAEIGRMMARAGR
ncbi:pyroglutamyl-peptidase I family protein [Bosea sp. (in: a-proteobacteria)]|jgi:pyroglutamyl-peptidase|uniref:pyroglutamyl-peptidase I family protein n=1 Tax=Bosea sp. (in: a-proteobacteria) TaxID=1871050 RepID=UPI003F70590F